MTLTGKMPKHSDR